MSKRLLDNDQAEKALEKYARKSDEQTLEKYVQNIPSSFNKKATKDFIREISKGANGSADVVEKAIKSGAYMHVQCSESYCALTYAASHGNIEIIDLLIEHGMNIHHLDSFGKTAILSAIHGRDPETIEFLIEKGANLNVTTRDGWTPLHCAVGGVNSEVNVGLLLQGGANPNLVVSYERITPLNRAISCGDKSVVKLLADRVQDINHINGYGDTYLHAATVKGDGASVKLLVDRGIEINTGKPENFYATLTPNSLIYKAALMNPQLLATLYRNYLIDEIPGIRTPLGCALRDPYLKEKNVEVINYLIENGAYVTPEMFQLISTEEAILPHFITALWCQNIHTGRVEELGLTVEDNLIPLLAKIMKGQLVERGSIKTLQQLEQSDNPNIQKIIQSDNFAEETRKAITDKHAVRLFNMMLSGKIQDIPHLGTFPEEEQKMVAKKIAELHEAHPYLTTSTKVLYQALENDKVPEHMREEFQKLLCRNERALVFSKALTEEQALTISQKNFETSKKAIEAGADEKTKNNTDKTPLNLATGEETISTIARLLREGADVNAKDEKNSTRLKQALINKQTDVVEILLENGAHVDQRMLKVVTSVNTLQHLSAALWCQNARIGEVKDLPSILGKNPIPLLCKIMKGQLAEEGSIETLNQILNSDNSTVKSIINTDNFAEEAINRIAEKHAVRLFNSILSGKAYDKPGLCTLSPAQQDIVVNKVKSLCTERGISSYEKPLDSNVPEHMQEKLKAALGNSEKVTEEFTNHLETVSSESSHTLFDLKNYYDSGNKTDYIRFVPMDIDSLREQSSDDGLVKNLDIAGQMPVESYYDELEKIVHMDIPLSGQTPVESY